MGLMPYLTDIAHFVTTQLMNFEIIHYFDILVTSLIIFFPSAQKKKPYRDRIKFFIFINVQTA